MAGQSCSAKADRRISPTRRLMLMALRPSSFPPSNPCAPWTLILQHWRLSPPELFASDIQDAHHDAHPAILHSLHSAAHEPDEEPNRLQGGGSHRRVYDHHHAGLDNGHAHIDDVPGHHRHFAARHIIRLMLRYTPRCWICWGWMSSCHPVCTASSARKGACLDVFAYSATFAYALWDICRFIMERAVPTPR